MAAAKFLVALLLVLPTPYVFAWPDRPVRVIVPYGAGSTPDALARITAEQLAQLTGKPFIVENKPGGGGMVGTQLVVNARPDGHTLVVSAAGPLLTNPLLFKRMPYDPERDLAPVALLGESTSVLVVGPAIKARNVKELLAEIRQSGRRLAYGSPGKGTQGHLSLAHLASLAGGGEMVHVPYASSPQISAALLSGDIDMTVTTAQAMKPLVDSGRLRVLAVTGTNRHADFPDVPTLREQGVSFGITGWVGLATTAGTRDEVIQAIYQATRKASSDRRVREQFRMNSVVVVLKGPQEFQSFMREEYVQWKALATANNVFPE